MFTKFWKELGEELAGRWASQTLGPMLAFWGGGVLAWIWQNDWNWQQVERKLAEINTPAAYVAQMFVLLDLGREDLLQVDFARALDEDGGFDEAGLWAAIEEYYPDLPDE